MLSIVFNELQVSVFARSDMAATRDWEFRPGVFCSVFEAFSAVQSVIGAADYPRLKVTLGVHAHLYMPRRRRPYVISVGAWPMTMPMRCSTMPS